MLTFPDGDHPWLHLSAEVRRTASARVRTSWAGYYAMPGMTGLQLAEELHRLRPRLAVLLATGYPELQGTAASGLVRLAKPFAQEALAEAMDRCSAAMASAPGG
jgi:DNA-binding LytR/AlgR family response regulator